jgi:hypothetical protein
MRKANTLILPLIVGGGLLLGTAADASAHERGYRHEAVHTVGRVHSTHYQPAFPRWLRSHRDFHRWYRHSHYRFGPRMSWDRLFVIYGNDRHYHRHHHRKYKGKRRIHDRHWHRSHRHH